MYHKPSRLLLLLYAFLVGYTTPQLQANANLGTRAGWQAPVESTAGAEFFGPAPLTSSIRKMDISKYLSFQSEPVPPSTDEKAVLIKMQQLEVHGLSRFSAMTFSRHLNPINLLLKLYYCNSHYLSGGLSRQNLAIVQYAIAQKGLDTCISNNRTFNVSLVIRRTFNNPHISWFIKCTLGVINILRTIGMGFFAILGGYSYYDYYANTIVMYDNDPYLALALACEAEQQIKAHWLPGLVLRPYLRQLMGCLPLLSPSLRYRIWGACILVNQLWRTKGTIEFVATHFPDQTSVACETIVPLLGIRDSILTYLSISLANCLRLRLFDNMQIRIDPGSNLVLRNPGLPTAFWKTTVLLLGLFVRIFRNPDDIYDFLVRDFSFDFARGGGGNNIAHLSFLSHDNQQHISHYCVAVLP